MSFCSCFPNPNVLTFTFSQQPTFALKSPSILSCPSSLSHRFTLSFYKVSVVPSKNSNDKWMLPRRYDGTDWPLSDPRHSQDPTVAPSGRIWLRLMPRPSTCDISPLACDPATQYTWNCDTIHILRFPKVLTISVRQAAVAAQRTMTFQYGRPLERHS